MPPRIEDLPMNGRAKVQGSVIGAALNGNCIVPASQVDPPGVMDLAASAAALKKAAPLVGRDLTRQSSGVVGQEMFKRMQEVNKEQRNAVGRRKQGSHKKRPLFQIDPRSSSFTPWWDLVMSIAILFTALVTPYEVSFLPMATGWQWPAGSGLFLLNRFIDVLFIMDMAVNFVLVYDRGSAGEEGVFFVEDPKLIIWHYLTGWFGLDFVSVGVSGLDIYALAIPAPKAGDASGGSGGSFSGLRALRALRALRLIKLVRLFRASRMWKYWESKVAVNYKLLEFIKCLVVLQISAHWFACIWGLQASLISNSVLEAWPGNYGYCEARAPAPASDASTSAVHALAQDASFAPCPVGWVCRADTPGVSCLPAEALYGASIYWAIATIVSVGYGDIGATPHNTAEQIMCAILMSVGGVIWGYVVGTFCGSIANLSPATSDFRNNMDDLNSFMRENHMNKSLQTRLREYFHRTRHIHNSQNQQRLLSLMSPMLQSEVVLSVNHRWLRSVWCLQHVEDEFLVALTMSLSPMVLAPYELAPCGFLYVLYRGIVILGGDLITKGRAWGEDIILANVAPSLIRPINAKAMNYAEVFICSWDAMSSGLQAFPASAEIIRHCALRLAMRRQLVRCAAALKRMRNRTDGDVVEETLRATGHLPELRENSCRNPSLGASFRKARTVHKMFERTTSVSDAAIHLQKELINKRREESGNVRILAEEMGEEITLPQGYSKDLGNIGTSSLDRQTSQKHDLQRPNSRRSNAATSDVAVPREGMEVIEALARAVTEQATALKRLSADVAKLTSKGVKEHADLGGFTA